MTAQQRRWVPGRGEGDDHRIPRHQRRGHDTVKEPLVYGPLLEEGGI
jgi:hypothetical protein